ncbi:hypothetical protein FQA39_LY08141 [Lamprigera yunnana]|nr:hypothetical protein FQA39_LY08141 [Lamprigera yunnana]
MYTEEGNIRVEGDKFIHLGQSITIKRVTKHESLAPFGKLSIILQSKEKSFTSKYYSCMLRVTSYGAENWAMSQNNPACNEESLLLRDRKSNECIKERTKVTGIARTDGVANPTMATVCVQTTHEMARQCNTNGCTELDASSIENKHLYSKCVLWDLNKLEATRKQNQALELKRETRTATETPEKEELEMRKCKQQKKTAADEIDLEFCISSPEQELTFDELQLLP